MPGFFIGIRATVQKVHSDNLELSESSEFPVRCIMGSELSFLLHTYFSMIHGIMLEIQGGKSVFWIMRL